MPVAPRQGAAFHGFKRKEIFVPVFLSIRGEC